MEREVMNVGILQLEIFTVATVPAAAKYTGCLIYVSNGASGNPCLARSNGTNWIQVNTATTAITAT